MKGEAMNVVLFMMQ
jgi:hypothetical protein